MKKFLSAILTLAIVFSCTITSFAAAPEDAGTKKTVENSGYSFEITEYVDEYNRIIRTYENNNIQTRSAPDLAKTKAVLVALGMQEENVNMLNTEALNQFALSREITIATAYTKTDGNNNVSYLPEDEAIAAASSLKAKQDAIKFSYAQQGAVTRAADYEDTFEDSYMRVDYAVTYRGDGEYFYSVDSEWLTMPAFRFTDSLGACAMNGTITTDSQYGYYWYDSTFINMGNVTKDYTFEYINDNYGNDVDGNWYGSAGYFNLPNDVYSEYSSIIHDNFGAHFQYSGHVTSPDEQRWFNTVGNYTHATLSVALSPSISIDYSGSLSASVGIDVVGDTDIRGVEFEINYIPDN